MRVKSMKLVRQVRDYPLRLHLEISEEAEKFELEYGDAILARLERILDVQGSTKAAIGEDVTWEVGEFPHMLSIPRELVERYNVKPSGITEAGDSLELILKEVVKKSGQRITIEP